MNKNAPTQTTKMKKVGEIRHKAFALFMSVLLAITCLPILPGNVEEAHAETVGTTTTTTVGTGTNVGIVWDTATGDYKWVNVGGWALWPGGTMAPPGSTALAMLNMIVSVGGSSFSYGDVTKTMTFTLLSYNWGKGDGTLPAFKYKIDFPEFTITSGAYAGYVVPPSTQYTERYFNGTSWVWTAPVLSSTTATRTTNTYYNPTFDSSPLPPLVKTIGDTISSVSDWSSGVTAKWGNTTTNTIPTMGTITDDTLGGGTTDGHLSSGGTVFDRVGVKKHDYTAKDDHSLDTVTPAYSGDTTSTTAARNVIVQASTEPAFNIKYAATAVDKDGTTPIGGNPYNGEWTNQPLEMEASHTDPGTYETTIRKYEPFASGTFSTQATDLTNSHLINIPSYQIDSTTTTGTGFTSILREEDPMNLGTYIDLSPESTKKTVKIDTVVPVPSATQLAGTFTDTSTDALSGIDATRQKIAIVGSTDPAPSDAQYTSFSSGTYTHSAPGTYDVYVWAWDNAGNHTKTKVFDDLLIISADSPTISGKLATGPNAGNPLATNTWTNQDVTVTVTPPASITNAYSGLYNGLIQEDKSATINTTASKTYSAETAGTTLFGVMLDSTNTELSAHSSNYVVKIDKTIPVANVSYNGSPTFDFTDTSTDVASMVANSGIDAAETIIAIVPSGHPQPAKASYVPLAGETLPASGWYDVWVIAKDNAGNESVPAKAYTHISRSGLDEIKAKDFSWDIAKGVGPFTDAMTIMLGHVEGMPYGGSTPFTSAQFIVDPADLATIQGAIAAGQKGTTWNLKFSTPTSPTQASTTVKVTLFDSGSNVPTPPGPLAQELIFANDFTWGVSSGQVSPSAAKIMSQVVGYKANGDVFAQGALKVNSSELAAINAAISLGKKDITLPLTFDTDGSTGPAASVTINVTLFDNGPSTPPAAGKEHIVGNNFAWGITTGAMTDAEAYFLGHVTPTAAGGAPLAQANVSADTTELGAINAAIAAGKTGTTWPLTFTTDGSTGTAASVTIKVTLYDNGPAGPITPGVEHIVGNDFNWGITTGILDEPTSFILSGAVATAGTGLEMDVNTEVTASPSDLIAINTAIAAGQKGTTWPLTLITKGNTGTPASTVVNVTLYDNGPAGPIPAGSEHIVGNDFNWGISTGDLSVSDAQVLSFLAAADAKGFAMALSSTSANTTELDAINAAIAAGKKNTTWPLTFTTDGSTGTPASVTIKVTLYDNGPAGPIPAGSEHIVGNNFNWGIDSGNVDDAIAQHLGKVTATGANGLPLPASALSLDASELAALNAAIAAGKVGTTWPLTYTTDGSTGTPASVTIYVTLYDAGHQTPVAGDPYIVANHFTRAVSAGALDDDTSKSHSLVNALSSLGHTGDLAHITVDATELAAINASIAAADISQPPYPLTFTYTCPASSKTVSAVALVTLTGDPDLSVTKSVNKTKPLPGEKVTYTIAVKNNGNAASTGVWVKDYVPENTTYVSCDATGVYGCTMDGKEYVNWFIASLAAGQEVKLTMTVKISECSPGTEIKNIALYDVNQPGFPANPDDDPKGGKSNSASLTVAGEKKVLPTRTAKTGDATPFATGFGFIVVASLGIALVAGRKKSKNS